MELSFANGVQEYTVHGIKGDVIIRFNPTDGAFIQRLYNAFDTLDKKQDKYADEVQKLEILLKKEQEGKPYNVAKMAAVNKFLRIYYARAMELYK